MNIVIAIDSLKGSLTSLEAGYAIAEGISKAMPDAITAVRPLADGGEGTVEALTLGMGGKLETAKVTGPYGQPVQAAYGILPDGTTAVMEMSAAAGIMLTAPEDKNLLYATTFGVGEMIRDAIEKGCRKFIVGIGGSATNDGGTGMLQALGFGLLDENRNQVRQGAIGLKDIQSVSDEAVIPELKECSFKIACDVTSPLCGEQGASVVYGPQKGAGPEMVRQLDEWLENYAGLIQAKYEKADPKFPGSGADGGLGFAFLGCLNGVLESGIRIVLEETELEDWIRDADVVVTGEGRLDGQTVMGKAPVGVAALAQKHGKKVIAFSGSAARDASVCNEHGIHAFFPILRSAVSLEEAMDPKTARENLSAAAEQVFRLIRAFA